MKQTVLVLSTLFFLSCNLMAQEAHHDTTFKNTVRINVTPILITGQLGSFTVGYERVLNNRQSISANIGHLQLPTLITTPDGSPVEWISNLRNTGFIASLDYRFYFKRNRYAVPDGLYWGPFITYYYFDNKARLELFKNDVAQGSADVQTYLSALMVGVQLGYQFVLGKRWTIDLILLGPGVGFYDLQMGIDADAQLEGDPEYLQGVYDALLSIFPGAERLFEEQIINESGSTSFNGAGFRYVFQVGFRF